MRLFYGFDSCFRLVSSSSLITLTTLRCSFSCALCVGIFLYASMYVFSLFAISRYGSRVVFSKTPKYPKSSIVKIAFTALSFACFSVRLKDPRLICAFISLNLAFSSYFSGLPARCSDKRSMRRVSSCIGVK